MFSGGTKRDNELKWLRPIIDAVVKQGLLRLFRLMRDSISQNEKRRICVLSRDLNCTRYNLCGFVKDDVDYGEIIQMFLFCFIFMCL